MGFIFLSSGILFDATNEEGQLLQTKSGTCLALDSLATLILQVTLSSETKAQAQARLVSSLEATDAQIEEGLQSVLDQLLALGYLRTTPPPDVCGEEAEHVSFASEEVMDPFKPPQVSRDTLVGWEFFLTGRIANDPLPRTPLKRRVYALWKAGNMLLFMGYAHLVASTLEFLRQDKQAELLRQREWERIAQRISRLKSRRSHLGTDLLWRMARRELVFCQMLVRLLAPTGACLVRSIAFCTYLRALGLPAQVVIGRACFDLSSHYSFHAWTELTGKVVNDHDELQSGFVVLQRLPEKANVPQFMDDGSRISLNQKIICCVGSVVLLVLFFKAAHAKWKKQWHP
jgi:hypothetical protein